MLVSVFLLRPFSVKMSIKKSVLPLRYFSVHIFYGHGRKPFNTPIVICGALFGFGYILFGFGYICTFVIDVFRKILKS